MMSHFERGPSGPRSSFCMHARAALRLVQLQRQSIRVMEEREPLARCLVEVSRRTFPGLREDVLSRFSMDAMVEKTLAVYREVLGDCRT